MESQINDPVISGHVKNEDDFLQFLDFGKEASRDTVSFSEDEGTILDLWDQLNEFRLERAVLEAQQELPLAGNFYTLYLGALNPDQIIRHSPSLKRRCRGPNQEFRTRGPRGTGFLYFIPKCCK